MSKKNQSSDEEIWSKRFGNDYDDLEYVSRSERSRNERKRNSDGMSPMLTGTVIFLAVLILATIFYYVWYSNSSLDHQIATEDPKLETASNTEEEPEELEEEPEPEEEMDAETETTSETDSESEQETESPEELEQESELVSEPETTSEQETGSETEPQSNPDPAPETPPTNSEETYTVQAGDNMYRIALNHGMSTQELMSLNNLTEETVYVGQVLRVE